MTFKRKDKIFIVLLLMTFTFMALAQLHLVNADEWTGVAAGGFIETFDRTDNDTVGNGWEEASESGSIRNISISNNELYFRDTDPITATNQIQANETMINSSIKYFEFEYKYTQVGANTDPLFIRLYNSTGLVVFLKLYDTYLNLTDGGTTSLKVNIDHTQYNNISLLIDWNANTTEIFINGTSYGSIPFPAPISTVVDKITIGGFAFAHQSHFYTKYIQWGEEENIVTTLNDPSTDFSGLVDTDIFNATVTKGGNLNITNATFYLWYTNGTLFNSTINSSIINVTTNYLFDIANISVGAYKWNVYSCLNNGVCDWADTNNTWTRNYFTETTTTVNSTYDTDNVTFKGGMAVLTSATLYSISLNYEGRTYLAEYELTGGGGGLLNYEIERIIDIPNVTVSKTAWYNWTATLLVDGSYITQTGSNRNISVTATNISDAGTLPAVNFTIYDEETLLKIAGYFDGTFIWYLGSGTELKNKNYDKAAATDHIFYIDPDNRTFLTDLGLEIGNSSGSYQTRQYDFNNLALNNVTQEIELFLSNNSALSNIIIEVKDEGLVAQENIFVTIKRYYPATNEYKTVENRKTDQYGQFVAYLIENDVKYTFEFRDSDNTLLKTVSDMTVACRAVYCVIPFVIEDTTNAFLRFDDVDDFTYNLSFINSTNTYFFSWNDATDKAPTFRLMVTRYAWNGTSIVCNVTSNLKQGVLECDVGSNKASYVAQIFREASPELRTSSLSTTVGDNSATFGLEGLFISFILLMTLILIGIYSPPVAITLYMIGFVFLSIFDIIYVNPAILIANLVIGIAFIWAFRS